MSRSRKTFDVVGLGFPTLDHVCLTAHPPRFDSKEPMQEYFVQAGGQIPTALVALQRWGARTAFVGPITDDAGGEIQRRTLSEEGVDLGGARTVRGRRSHTSVILVDRVTGERTILWHRPPDLRLPAAALDREKITAGGIFFTDADDIDTAMVAARWARDAGCRVALDVDRVVDRTPELLSLTDIVIVSTEFARTLTGKADPRRAVEAMATLGPAVAIVTLGAGGAVGRVEGTAVSVPAFRLPTVDTTAAGDLFHAGYLFATLRDRPLPERLRFAAAAAALECGALGGIAAIPTVEQVRELMLRAESR